MKLSRLLQEHRKYKGGLEGNFGDAYLLSKNSIYRKVREQAVAAGYKFSDARNDAYETFPLLQIDSLLATKTFPYSNNLAAFTNLTSAQLDLLTWEDIDGNLKKNQVFHEACHAVARELMNQIWPVGGGGAKIEAERRQVLRMLVEESAANTAELFGLIEVEDQLHRIFYEMNSYNTLFEIRGNLKKAEQEFGAEPLMLFMMLSYVLSTVLRPGVTDRDFQKMLELTGMLSVDARAQKVLRVLAKVAFQLNERFRIQTTAFHLRLKGIQTPVADLFDFDVLNALDREKGALPMMSAFVSALN